MSAKLPTRKIGDTAVSAIGYGSMGLATAYGPVGTVEERLDVRISRRAVCAYISNPRHSF